MKYGIEEFIQRDNRAHTVITVTTLLENFQKNNTYLLYSNGTMSLRMKFSVAPHTEQRFCLSCSLYFDVAIRFVGSKFNCTETGSSLIFTK